MRLIEWPSGSKKRIYESCQYFTIFILFLLEKYVVINFIKLSLSPKSALCQVWLKLVHCMWFWRRDSLKLSMLFYFPLEKGLVIYFEQTWSVFQIKECFVLSFLGHLSHSGDLLPSSCVVRRASCVVR